MYDVYGEDMVVRYEEDEVEVRFRTSNVRILVDDVKPAKQYVTFIEGDV